MSVAEQAKAYPTAPTLSEFFLTTCLHRPALSFATCVLVASAALASDIARAHAIVVSAQPAMNATVAPGEINIRLAFNSQIDSQRSRLRLERPDGVVVAIALVPDGSHGVLAGTASATSTGRWKVHWQVLSLDGHITRGEIGFFVSGDGGPR